MPAPQAVENLSEKVKRFLTNKREFIQNKIKKLKHKSKIIVTFTIIFVKF